MITWILAALMVAAFSATVVIFFNILLDLFDWVVTNVKRLFKAIKVLRVKNDKAEVGVLTVDKSGNTTIRTEPKAEKVNIGQLDPKLKEKVLEAQSQVEGDTVLVETEITEEAEAKIRERRA
jgi:hypothetical protein